MDGVGWALHSVCHFCILFGRFSSRSEKFDWVNNDCFHLWNEHAGNGSLTLEVFDIGQNSVIQWLIVK